MQGISIAGGLMTAALALALAAGPVALAQDSTDATATEQPATPLAGPGLLEPLGIDVRASTELSPDELQARIDQLTAALDQPELPDDSKAQLTALLEADRAELAQRQAAATAGDATAQTAEPAVDATAPAQPAATAEEPAAQPSEPAIEDAITQQAEEQPVTEQPAEPVAEQPAEAAPAEGSAETGTESAPAVQAEPAPPPPAPETTAGEPAPPAPEPWPGRW